MFDYDMKIVWGLLSDSRTFSLIQRQNDKEKMH